MGPDQVIFILGSVRHFRSGRPGVAARGIVHIACRAPGQTRPAAAAGGGGRRGAVTAEERWVSLSFSRFLKLSQTGTGASSICYLLTPTNVSAETAKEDIITLQEETH